MDTLTAMRTLVHAVEGGSFAAAARALQLTPSAVSKHVAGLEDALGARLLQRTTRKLGLTPEGARVFDEAVALLARYDRLAREIAERSDAPVGRIRVTAPLTLGEFLVAPAIRDFIEKHPEVSVELDCTDRVVDVVAERFDVAIRGGVLPDSSLVAVRLADNDYHLCASPAYLESHGVPRTPEELPDHRCLNHSQWARAREWGFTRGGRSQRVIVQPRFESNSVRALHDAVRAGLGIGPLPAYLAGPDLADGALVELFAGDFVSPGGFIHAVLPTREHVPARVTGFVEYLRESFRRKGVRSPHQRGRSL